MKSVLSGWLREQLRRHEGIRSLYAHYDLWRKFGTPWPERVRMANSNHDLFINTREARGRALARGGCRGQPELKALWRKALAAVEPDLVLDVGANYGEFVFMPRYRGDAVVIAVEPQPSLRRYLVRSCATHPDAARIELVFSLAADAPGEDRILYVDEEWSGRSSAMLTRKMRRVAEVRVPVTSVDELVGERATASTRLLFKVDVEGYEPIVLDGMKATLEKVDVAVGIVELHRHNIEATGLTMERYFDSLRSRFAIHAVLPKGRVVSLVGKKLDNALSDPDYSADLLLLSDPELARELDLPIDDESG